MKQKEFDAGWRAAAEEALVGMKEWRLAHPKATLEEIEAALDERLARLRAQMLQDAAQASASRQWQELPAPERPICPDCRVPLSSRGRARRQLVTDGDQTVALERTYGTCPRCGRGLFPPR